MIIRNNMTPSDVQKQVDSMSKFKRGFNQTPKNINDKMNFGQKNSSSELNKEALELNKKMQALRNVSRIQK